jgi:hypothetical protein
MEKTGFSLAVKSNTILISEILSHNILIENRLKKTEQICSGVKPTRLLVKFCYGDSLIDWLVLSSQ